MSNKQNFDIKSLKIGIASPERIREWSYGEITKPETINYKSLKPERYGLFDEVIFGPVKDYECSCGKYKKVKYKGRKCDKCEVEITESIVRRERMGSIELASPIAHIWMTKELPNPSKISLLLDISYKDVEQVIYFVNYIVLDSGDYTYNGEKIFKVKEIVDLSNPKNNVKTRNKLRRILTDIAEMIKKDSKKGKNDFDFSRAKTYCEALKERNLPFSANEVFGFITKYTNIKFGIGAPAIKELLSKIDLDAEYNFIKNELKDRNDPDDQNVKKLLRRLEVIKWVKDSNNKPEWMVMDVIPVTPPDTRPIIQLDGGRFTTSDINTFYRKIIIRNERLKVLKNDFAPAILLNNECRMLQESVDSLFDNQSRKKPLVGRDKRPLKSLSNHLKGKQGLFRQNLLGKRVDYSGRSVIVVGPELKMYEVGIPAIMILKLFKPFIINELTKKEEKSLNPPLASSIKKAEEMILEQNSVIWPIVQKVIKDRPVLLNRAPTLHRLGIQAFKVKMIDGKAIRLHPLVTTAFNADFDGDQMAVHVPLSDEAVAEARLLMLGSWHILGAKDGKPIVTPTQDIILGIYYISREVKDDVGQGIIFNSIEEAKVALENKAISINSIIGICTSAFKDKVFEKQGVLITTLGKIIFNESLPSDYEYINSNFKNNSFLSPDDIIDFGQDIQKTIQNRKIQDPFGKSILSRLIDDLYKRYSYDLSIVPECLDKIKDLGFKYSTISATSISFFDVPEYSDKSKYITEAEHKVDELQKFASKGFLNEDERYVKTIEVWNDVKDKVTKDIRKIVESDEFKNNSIVIMANSGARGNISNFTQLTGMRGLMSKSYNYDQKSKSKVIKDTIEIPIKHSFIEGLSVSEYFNSTYGARKGLTDTAMKTSKSGYMTRKLVDATQEVIIKEEDCGTDVGITVSEIIDSKNSQLIETLAERIINRFSVYDIYNPNTQEIIVKSNELITSAKTKEIVDCGIKEVTVRSPMYCKCSIGICQKCFGIDLSTNKLIEKGVAIGIIAAQSIGEPGTQLTMRTFHTGGVSGESNITQGFERLKQLFEFTPLKKWEKATISEIDGKVISITQNDKDFEVVIKNNLDVVKYTINNNSKLRVKVNDVVKAGEKICEGSINIFELLLVSGVDSVRQYIIKEVQKVYRSQGIEISDKYIEVIVNQLTNKCIIVSPGDSDYFIGQTITINKFKEISQKLSLENKVPPIIIPKIFGLEVAPSKSGSFLSAASFQDTKKILTDAATKGQVDYLLGLKENVILGKLIPAGTGLIDKETIISNGNKLIEKEY